MSTDIDWGIEFLCVTSDKAKDFKSCNNKKGTNVKGKINIQICEFKNSFWKGTVSWVRDDNASSKKACLFLKPIETTSIWPHLVQLCPK